MKKSWILLIFFLFNIFLFDCTLDTKKEDVDNKDKTVISSRKMTRYHGFDKHAKRLKKQDNKKCQEKEKRGKKDLDKLKKDRLSKDNIKHKNKSKESILKNTKSLSVVDKKESKENVVHNIKSVEEHNGILLKKGLKVIKYYSPYCGPCNFMKPKYVEISKKYYPKVQFYELDTSDKKLHPVVNEQNIQAVPTIVFMKDDKEVKRERGTLSKDELDVLVDELINGSRSKIITRK
jgi:thioredoxin 1